MMTSLLFFPGMLNDARLWRAQQAALAGRWTIRHADLTIAETVFAMADSIGREGFTGQRSLNPE